MQKQWGMCCRWKLADEGRDEEIQRSKQEQASHGNKKDDRRAWENVDRRA
jgi:hypothetical protein